MNESLKKIIKEMNGDENIAIIKKSNRPDLCDYQFDGTFALAKVLHKNPMELGNMIVESLQKDPETEKKFSKIECVKPGFINFTLTDEYINLLLTDMLTKPKFNVSMPKQETIVIDYGGANVAKPLHVGHLRPAIVGESIKDY